MQRENAIVLDLCCGTGDLSLALRKSGKARIIGADFAHTMLTRARAKRPTTSSSATKIKKKCHSERSEESAFVRKPRVRSCTRPTARLLVVEADALRLPFADQSFDLVTTAFGFRNLANYDSGLREIHRILKPGGTIAILEFTEPPDNFLGNLYRWYFRRVLPRIGAALSGDSSAYTYLPKSVSRSSDPRTSLCHVCRRLHPSHPQILDLRHRSPTHRPTPPLNAHQSSRPSLFALSSQRPQHIVR